MTVFYIGSTFSGKERLADGTKADSPVTECFVDSLINYIKRKGIKAEFRMKMLAIISEKVYDCFS